jgi:translation initiation factor IF-2
MLKEQSRPPIVTILGHVDHGKTTLLDAIRKTSVATKEFGGITQSIGASSISTKEGKKITFIDTPGHAAFSKMRSRGAAIADIVILVVAGEDGVKPQTVEALNITKEAKIPIIVAITKMDLNSASADIVLGQLEKQGLVFETRGGDTPWVPVSAKTSKGIDDLLELIILVSEINGIKANPEAPLQAPVIETSKGKSGPLVSVVVRNGTLRVGDLVSGGGKAFKVRGLLNDKGLSVKEILPGEPGAIMGFEEMPPIGALIKSGREEVTDLPQKTTALTKIEKGQIPVLIKADNAGSLEVVIANLPKEMIVIDSGVGDIFESDILLARASGVKFIFAFGSKVSLSVLKLAEAEGIKIETFKIIYELFDRMKELITKGQLEVLGKSQIIASFPFNKRKVAGCKVLQGKISKADNLMLVRGEKEIGKVKSLSMKKGKLEITEAKSGEEFGIIFEPQLDFALGDMLISLGK